MFKVPALVRVFVLSYKFNRAIDKNDLAKAKKIEAEAKEIFFPTK